MSRKGPDIPFRRRFFDRVFFIIEFIAYPDLDCILFNPIVAIYGNNEVV